MNPVRFVVLPWLNSSPLNANPTKWMQIRHKSDANPTQIPRKSHEVGLKKVLPPTRYSLICCKPGQRTTHDGTVAINHREEKHGILTRAITGKIPGACHTKPQKLYARHCVTKQCLGVYLSFVTDVHHRGRGRCA